MKMIRRLRRFFRSCWNCGIYDDDEEVEPRVDLEKEEVLVKDVEDEPVVNFVGEKGEVFVRDVEDDLVVDLVKMKGEDLIEVEDVKEEVENAEEAEHVECLMVFKKQEKNENQNSISELNKLKLVIEEKNLETANLKKENEQLKKANNKAEIQMCNSRILNSLKFLQLEGDKMREYVDYQCDETTICRWKEYTLNNYKELLSERKPDLDNIIKSLKRYIEVEEEYQEHIIKFYEFMIRIHSEAKANNESEMFVQLSNIKRRIKQSISMLDEVSDIAVHKLKPKIGCSFESLSGDSCQLLSDLGMSHTARPMTLHYDSPSVKSRGVERDLTYRVISDITKASPEPASYEIHPHSLQDITVKSLNEVKINKKCLAGFQYEDAMDTLLKKPSSSVVIAPTSKFSLVGFDKTSEKKTFKITSFPKTIDEQDDLLSSEGLFPPTIKNEQLLMTKSLSETIIEDIEIYEECSIDSEKMESQRRYHQSPVSRIYTQSSEKFSSKQFESMVGSQQKKKNLVVRKKIPG